MNTNIDCRRLHRSRPVFSKSRLTLGVGLTALALATGPAPLAWSQDDDTHTTNTQVDRIVVTAQRREQDVQDVGLSLTVVGGGELEERGVVSTQGLQDFVAGLSITSSQVNNPAYSIRGIGFANDDVSSDSGVGVFLDDVYLPRASSANLSMLDVERVEVLKGPQGTLFGRNTIGGSINIITRKPSNTFESTLNAEVGNLGAINLGGYASGPLVEDRLFIGVSAMSRQRDGYMTNLFDGQDGRRVDTTAARLTLRWTPTDQSELLLSADMEETRPGPNLKSIGPDGPFQMRDITVEVPPSDPVYSANVDDPGNEWLDAHGYMGRFTLDGEATTFVAIAGVRSSETFFREDIDGSPLSQVAEQQAEQSDSRTAELRLSSTDGGSASMGGRLHWTSGLFHFHEEADKHVLFELPLFAPFGIAGTSVRHAVETDAFAAYGQASYDLTDRLGVTVGARWTRETKDFSATGEGIPQGSEGPGNPLIEEVIDARTSRTWEDTSFRFGLDYDLTSDVLLYVNLAQGFKSGGFNGQPVTNADALMGFEPEYAEQIEFGWRADLFDNRLRINGAIYQTDYQDLQISAVPDIGSPFTANAANAEVTGFELEYSWSPTPNFTLSGSTAYIDATFKDFTVFEQGALRVRDGERMRGIPEWTTSLSGQYVQAIPQGTLVFRGDYVWQDERVSNDQDVHAPAWDRTDLRVTYLSPDDQWSLSAWVRNAFDEVYWLRVGPEVTAPASMRRALAPPQTFGISLQVNL